MHEKAMFICRSPRKLTSYADNVGFKINGYQNILRK